MSHEQTVKMWKEHGKEEAERQLRGQTRLGLLVVVLFWAAVALAVS